MCVGLRPTNENPQKANIVFGKIGTAGDAAATEESHHAESDTSRAQKSPCEECGRPCPAGQSFCRPCQKDIRDRKSRPATKEEIREHWRKNEDGEDSPSLTAGQRIRAAIPRLKRVVYYVLATTIGGYAILERERLLDTASSFVAEVAAMIA